MLTSYQLAVILRDERITEGLSDPDGRCLIERLVQLADTLALKTPAEFLNAALQNLLRKFAWWPGLSGYGHGEIKLPLFNLRHPGGWGNLFRLQRLRRNL